VQIALDDLLRNKKVLHISHEHPVDRVRSFYDEIFHDLALANDLVQAQMVRVEVERNRLIYAHLDEDDAPKSVRGGTSSIGRIEQSVSFAREVAHFSPDAVIIDGFDFEHASDEAMSSLKKLASELDAEVWLSSRASASTSEAALEFKEQVDVIVQLEGEGKKVRLSLLKDHDSKDVSELHLLLDPVNMRILDEDLPPVSNTPREPGRYHLYAGGTKGAETAFGECAEKWGLKETHFSFDGHPFRARERGLTVLGEDELKRGDFSLVYASHRMSRPLSGIPEIKQILQTVWHQITAASEVFVIGRIQDDGHVKGGTGWGAELARLWSKPLHVFDQEKGQWFRWDGQAWVEEEAPSIQRTAFAGVGTTRLNDKGKKAIEDLFVRSFGNPS